MKKGTCRETGQVIGGIEYLRQRLIDALETELGSLVVERGYGSRLHELIDMNNDPNFEMECYVRVVHCIANPKNGLDDFRLQTMEVVAREPAQVTLNLVGEILDDGEPIELEGIVIDATRNQS